MESESKALKPTTMRLPDDLKLAMKQQAECEGLTTTGLTIVILREGLARRKKALEGGEEG